MRKNFMCIVVIAIALLLLTGCPGVIKPNTPPGEPQLVSPSNGSDDQELTVTLDWSATDPDGDSLKYDLYFVDLDTPFVQNLSSSEYIIDGAATGTTYQWKVVAKDNRGGEAEGNVWTFKTRDTLPTPDDVIIKSSTMPGLMNVFEDRKEQSGLPSEYAVNGLLNALSVFPQMVETYLGAASIIINDPMFQEYVIGNRRSSEAFSPENITEGLFENLLDPEYLKSLIPVDLIKSLAGNFNSAGTCLPIADIQDSFDLLLTGFENAHDDLSNILQVLGMPGYEILLYPNEFDNDGDGIVEPYAELKLNITYNSTNTTSFGLYSELIPSLAGGSFPIDPTTIVSIEPDSTGGDAIYDEAFTLFILGINDSFDGNFVFNDTDFIPIDKGDIAAILGLVDALSIVHTPLVVWDLQPDMDSLEIIVAALASDDEHELFVAMDTNNDENLTQTEAKAFLGEDFLTFRNAKSAERLSRMRDLVEELPEIAMFIADDIENDSDGQIGITDLLIPAEAVPVIRGFVEEYIGFFPLLRDEAYVTEMYFTGETEPLTFKPWILFDSPENFSNLMNFFPTINDFIYQNGDFAVILPDPTFGGIAENIPAILNHQTDTVYEEDFLDCDSPESANNFSTYEDFAFDSVNDTDWFSLNITNTATYFIAALDVANCGLELYSSENILIATGSYISDKTDIIQIIAQLESGEYYVKVWNKNVGVEGYELNYGEINPLLEDSNEQNNTKETATNIAGFYPAIPATFETGSDVDWYTFTLVEAKELYLETTSTSSVAGYIDPEFCLYNSSGTKIGESYFAYNCENLHVDLEAGQYFIEVSSRGNNIGGYHLEDD